MHEMDFAEPILEDCAVRLVAAGIAPEDAGHLMALFALEHVHLNACCRECAVSRLRHLGGLIATAASDA